MHPYLSMGVVCCIGGALAFGNRVKQVVYRNRGRVRLRCSGVIYVRLLIPRSVESAMCEVHAESIGAQVPGLPDPIARTSRIGCYRRSKPASSNNFGGRASCPAGPPCHCNHFLRWSVIASVICGVVIYLPSSTEAGEMWSSHRKDIETRISLVVAYWKAIGLSLLVFMRKSDVTPYSRSVRRRPRFRHACIGRAGGKRFFGDRLVVIEQAPGHCVLQCRADFTARRLRVYPRPLRSVVAWICVPVTIGLVGSQPQASAKRVGGDIGIGRSIFWAQMAHHEALSFALKISTPGPELCKCFRRSSEVEMFPRAACLREPCPDLCFNQRTNRMRFLQLARHERIVPSFTQNRTGIADQNPKTGPRLPRHDDIGCFGQNHLLVDAGFRGSSQSDQCDLIATKGFIFFNQLRCPSVAIWNCRSTTVNRRTRGR